MQWWWIDLSLTTADDFSRLVASRSCYEARSRDVHVRAAIGAVAHDRTAWQTHSEPEESFISVAVSHWEMVVTRQGDSARLTVRGPETRATTAPIPAGRRVLRDPVHARHVHAGAAAGQLVDRSVTLPPATRRSVRLDGSGWSFPEPGQRRRVRRPARPRWAAACTTRSLLPTCEATSQPSPRARSNDGCYAPRA